jgi:nucleoside-diphosphate-sugar epimerase
MTGTALVTGATGFVGSHLTRRLVREGREVHVLLRAGSSPWRLCGVLSELRTHDVDLRDGPGLRRVVEAVRPEYIFHLAGSPSVAGRTGSASELVADSLLGTVNLVDACESVDYAALIHTGDAFEYGASAEPLREGSGGAPDSLPGIAKLAATLYAQSVARRFGRPIVALRLFSAYGPQNHPKRLVPRLIAGALAGMPIHLSRPDVTRDWVYVDDLVELYLAASRQARSAAGEVLNAGTGRGTALVDLLECVLRLTGADPEVRWGAFPSGPHDATPWVADTGHTRCTLGWQSVTSLDDGLRATIASMT